MSSRLPRPASSPDRLGPLPNLKRKAVDQLEEDDGIGPLKMSALSHPSKPGSTFRPPRPLTASSSNIPPSNIGTTKPRVPPIRSGGPGVNGRSTNAPIPKSTRAVSAPPPKSTRPTTASGARYGAARVKTEAAAIGPDQIQDLREEIKDLRAEQAAKNAKVAEDMDVEKLKVLELQQLHAQQDERLLQARTAESESRRLVADLQEKIEDLQKKHSREIMTCEMDQSRLQRQIESLKDDLRVSEADLRRERDTISSLKTAIAEQSTAQVTLEARIAALQAASGNIQGKLDESDMNAGRLKFELEQERQRTSELEDKLREAETLRRKLHNTIQELKGNIRVFCRVRPVLPSELTSSPSGSELAAISFPDTKEHREISIVSSAESATGVGRKENWEFAFDKVFEPQATQAEVFEEISQLAQSCIDGYNVCIFAYGQTGSGKSFTMEGGPTEATAGMIPRAVEQVFSVAAALKSKGWEYKMEGQFLEIYNETINDLLGKGEFDKKKHEIKHDKGSTRVTDVVTVPLESPSEVRSLLMLAHSRRTVASTLMNERSSRSHSVFTLRISGTNGVTRETCEGTLNLVDLAGSERLNSSGAAADKDRLKETQNINKSLSALADVIGALGEKSERNEKHIPYRNSKLTYLLQNSLSGHSKTLMVLNLSPLAAHLGESLCSLRFATKVNNTTLGTARKQARVVS
ncbi:kinesin-domain-containing protein [Sistotremastrum suecicum HHB10207 ss-3]|uniref:Kinesin-like protein n=1 Tax=Sistotremastrum suecicum HHB10207 ss-3 TaxID=1314776 RepID=A0A166HU20_9AGAM|nr:kinesin-domain-containing protein [Sistotremastrum suecicum HHB10207 ss-3]